MSEIDLLDELGPGHDAEECEDRPCDWHLAMLLAADVKRLTAERDEARAERYEHEELASRLRTELDVAGDYADHLCEYSQRLTAELATATEVARRNKQHYALCVAYSEQVIVERDKALAEVERYRAELRGMGRAIAGDAL